MRSQPVPQDPCMLIFPICDVFFSSHSAVLPSYAMFPRDQVLCCYLLFMLKPTSCTAWHVEWVSCSVAHRETPSTSGPLSSLDFLISLGTGPTCFVSPWPIHHHFWCWPMLALTKESLPMKLSDFLKKQKKKNPTKQTTTVCTIFSRVSSLSTVPHPHKLSLFWEENQYTSHFIVLVTVMY